MSVESREKTGTFSVDALNELSWAKNEPEWLRDLRVAALKAWEQLPMPSRKDEEWRRTDLSMLEWDAIRPYSPVDGRVATVADLPDDLRLGVGESLPEGLRVQRNSLGAFENLSERLSSKGVIFADMDTAIREHGDLVRRYLMSQVSSTEGKFQALHGAFWSGGTFLYVPRNVEVDVPLRSVTWSDETGLAVMPHTLVVLEENASVAFVDEFLSTGSSSPIMSNGVTELVLGQNSSLRYASLQRWGAGTFSFGTQRAGIGRDAFLSSLSVVLGSKLTKSWIDSLLLDQGAHTEMVGIMFATGKQRFHHHTLQDHRAPNTTSDLLFKAALSDEARSEYSGMIKVHKDAQKTDAYQANRNLALSEHARADSMPKLEIEANDVRCTHGATVGPIDLEQVFYLQARGLPRKVAERMIVEGFFEQVLEKIPLEDVRETVRAAVAAKLEGR